MSYVVCSMCTINRVHESWPYGCETCCAKLGWNESLVASQRNAFVANFGEEPFWREPPRVTTEEPESAPEPVPEPEPTTTPPSFSFESYTGLYRRTDRPQAPIRTEPDWLAYTTLTPAQRYHE